MQDQFESQVQLETQLLLVASGMSRSFLLSAFAPNILSYDEHTDHTVAMGRGNFEGQDWPGTYLRMPRLRK